MPEKERAKLAVWLLESLPASSGEEAEAESVDEADRRRKELDSGQVSPMSENEFWTSIDQERKQWR